MTDAAFDLWQQAFTLAAMSAGEELRRGMPDALAMALNDTLKAFLSQSNTVDAIGRWATVSGPVVFESRPNGHSYADNAMNVAANADQTVYVVGIAGTNPTSIYDWLREDLGVEHTTSWTAAFPGLQPYGLPDSSSLNPYISASTALGVNNLLHMVDRLQGTNKDLLTFLQSLPVPQTRKRPSSSAGTVWPVRCRPRSHWHFSIPPAVGSASRIGGRSMCTRPPVPCRAMRILGHSFPRCSDRSVRRPFPTRSGT